MKKGCVSILFLSVLIIILACLTTTWVAVRGLGQVIEEERAVSDFSGVDLQRIAISGSGDYEARGLASDKTEVYVSGSGSTDLQARNSLAVVISGSGDVYYTGSPTVEQSIMGSGRIKPITTLGPVR